MPYKRREVETEKPRILCLHSVPTVHWSERGVFCLLFLIRLERGSMSVGHLLLGKGACAGGSAYLQSNTPWVTVHWSDEHTESFLKNRRAELHLNTEQTSCTV